MAIEQRERMGLILELEGGKPDKHGALKLDCTSVEAPGVEREEAPPRIMLFALSPGHVLLEAVVWCSVWDLGAEDGIIRVCWRTRAEMKHMSDQSVGPGEL